jgi:SAM-dependent methyltransferase
MGSPGDQTQERQPREGTRRALGVETHQRWLAERQALFAEMFRFEGRGLEIGPLDTPAVNPQTADVSYVDVYDRAGTVSKYADDDMVLVDLIPETTFPLWDGDRVRTLSEAAAPGAPFDWVLASHVVEHVPDLISWLADIARLTGPDGALVLAAPDRRFTFDCHRPPTTVGQVIEAHLRGDRQPGPRAVYDHEASYVDLNGIDLTSGARPPGRSARRATPLVAFEAAKRAADDYIDLHVWAFTVYEFIELIAELREIGVSNWYVERLGRDPRNPEFEFRMVLRKVPSDGRPFNEVATMFDLPPWLAEQWQIRATAGQLTAQLAEAMDLLKRLSETVQQQQGPS